MPPKSRTRANESPTNSNTSIGAPSENSTSTRRFSFGHPSTTDINRPQNTPDTSAPASIQNSPSAGNPYIANSADEVAVENTRAPVIVMGREVLEPVRCPSCRNVVVPQIVMRKDTCSNFIALVLCLLCLWPCALCVYCSPCSVMVYTVCPVCSAVFKMERLS